VTRAREQTFRRLVAQMAHARRYRSMRPPKTTPGDYWSVRGDEARRELARQDAEHAEWHRQAREHARSPGPDPDAST
jgi:hypothetical protein